MNFKVFDKIIIRSFYCLFSWNFKLLGGFMSENKYQYFLEHFTGQLPLGEAFDLVERQIVIGGRHGRLYFVDGLSDSEKLQLLFNFLLAVPEDRMQKVENTEQFVAELFPFINSSIETDIDAAVKFLYSGLSPIILDGFDKIIVADTRDRKSVV